MNILYVGAGSFRFPSFVAQVLEHNRTSDAPIRGIWAVDVSPRAAAAARRVSDALLALAQVAPGRGVELHWLGGPDLRPSDLPEDLSAMIVGIRAQGPGSRRTDEHIARRLGLMGQETVGIGGLAMALRNVPGVLGWARRVAELRPGAWIVNLTNPAGIVTQALADAGHERVVGVCDTPAELSARTRAYLDRQGIRDAAPGYFGLNHLGYIVEVRRPGGADARDALPRTVQAARAHSDYLAAFGEAYLATHRSLPSEYVLYYHLWRTLEQAPGAMTRARAVEELTRRFRALGRGQEPSAVRSAYRGLLEERSRGYMRQELTAALAPPGERDRGELSGAGYARIALEVLRCVSGLSREPLVLNLPLGAVAGIAVPAALGMGRDDVVETHVTLDPQGWRSALARPPELEADAAALVAEMKAYDRLAARAAAHLDRDAFFAAWWVNPLLRDVRVAERALAELVRAYPALGPLAR